MIYGYCRCSTNENKQDIERQERELKDAGAEIIFKEFEHGDAVVKKELEKLLEIIRQGDTIITTEVSRLSRSTKQLCEIIETIKEKKLCLSVCNSITIDCRSGELDPVTGAFIQMAGVFSELELAMIRARVKSGMQNAKAKGKKLGRPTLDADKLPADFYKHYPTYQAKKINKTEFARLIEVSRPTLDKYLQVLEESTKAIKKK